MSLFDGSPWDLEEGVDFPEGEWRRMACKLKDIAMLLGGYGSAAELISRDKRGKELGRRHTFHYLHRGTGWRDGL